MDTTGFGYATNGNRSQGTGSFAASGIVGLDTTHLLGDAKSSGLEVREMIAWAAQPKQQILISCPIEDALFGGARGGGKTDGLLGDFLLFANAWGRHARGILLRRKYPEFEEVQRRSHEIYPYTGAFYKVGDRTWIWPNGATLKLRFLDKDSDAEAYIGHSYTWLGVDQMEQWPSPVPIDKLRATLRAGEIAIPKYFRCTANPGGVGHNWIKSRYKIGVVQPMTPFYDEKLKTHRVYIPSRLEDNYALMKNDPTYWTKVEASVAGNKALLAAWRWGSWDIAAGGMFDDLFREELHVLDTYNWNPPNDDWYVDRSLDWGSDKPFWIGWWAESPGDFGPHRIWMPRGTKILFKEWYGCRYEETGDDADMNVGIKMVSREVAKEVIKLEKDIKSVVYPGGADSQIKAQVDGKTIQDIMKEEGVLWKIADKGPGSRKTGWELLRTRMHANLKLEEVATYRLMEHPGIFITRDCKGWLRTVPTLPRDDKNSDDVDSDAEDHPGDGSRYEFASKRAEYTVGEYLM